MTKVSDVKNSINELVNNLRALTNELTDLHGDLYWLAMQGQDSSAKPAAGELNVELLTELKGAVDNMRLMLWNYIASAEQVDPEKVQEGTETERLQRMSRFLQLLRDRLGRRPDEQPVSFIEKISAAMKKRLGDKVA
ncbi:MAG TPA: hypothetical protein VKE93_09060 [Candidatus Angelobacter sp.]|nr:hypothetical protein [Candidatus Angelobacter sp.]